MVSVFSYLTLAPYIFSKEISFVNSFQNVGLIVRLLY